MHNQRGHITKACKGLSSHQQTFGHLLVPLWALQFSFVQVEFSQFIIFRRLTVKASATAKQIIGGLFHVLFSDSLSSAAAFTHLYYSYM